MYLLAVVTFLTFGFYWIVREVLRKRKLIQMQSTTPNATAKGVLVSELQERRHFFLQVHGVKFNQAVVKECRVGEEVVLVPEPENLHDRFAVMVCRQNGALIGRIPVERSRRMSSDIATGWRYRVTIEEIYSFADNSNLFGCKIRLGVLRMSDRTEARLHKRINQKST